MFAHRNEAQYARTEVASISLHHIAGALTDRLTNAVADDGIVFGCAGQRDSRQEIAHIVADGDIRGANQANAACECNGTVNGIVSRQKLHRALGERGDDGLDDGALIGAVAKSKK